LKDDELFGDEISSKDKNKKKVSKKISEDQQKTEKQQFDLMSQSIGLVWAVGLIVVAFVAGFFIRGLFLSGTQSSEGGTMQAPPLTEEQMRGGKMPEGHPPIGEMPLTTESAPMGGMGDSTQTTITP